MKKEKVKLRKTELPVDMVVPGMAPREVGSLTEKEGQMIANDKLEKDRQVRGGGGQPVFVNLPPLRGQVGFIATMVS